MAYEIRNVYMVGEQEFETEEEAKKHIERLRLRDRFSDFYYHHPLVANDDDGGWRCKVPEEKAFNWFMKLYDQL